MTDTPNLNPSPDPGKVDHAWIHEHLGAALAAGLDPHDQARFDAHINGCAECFDDFTEARDADRALSRALAALAPSAQFDETLQETLREKMMHQKWRPIMKRAGMAIAASVALAATGVFAQYVVGHDGITKSLAQPMTERMVADARSRGITIPLSFLSEDDRPREIANRSHRMMRSAGGQMEVADGPSGRGGASWRDTVDSSLPVMDAMAPVEEARAIQKLANKETGSQNEKSWNSANYMRDGQNVAFDGGTITYGAKDLAVPTMTGIPGSLATTTLQGENAYSGGTTISGGAVAMGPTSGNIITSSGAVTMNGGTLGGTGSITTGRAFAGQGGGQASGKGGITVDYNGADSSFVIDELKKTGSGKLAMADATHSMASNAPATDYFKPDGENGKGDTLAYGDALHPPQLNLSDVKKGFEDNDETNSRLTTLDARRQSEVAGLMKTAAELDQGQKQKEATDTLRHVLVLDPQNEEAKLALKLINDKITYRAWQSVPGEQSKESQRLDVDNQEHLIPYVDLLVYPENWLELTRNQVADARKPDATHNGQAVANTQAAPAATAPEAAHRKIIRNGDVEFEVRSFDDASATISAVVIEEGGFVSSTSSEKLANGKIRGTVIVRVPPEHLDRMLLKLRALGDLKTQQIAASDVTKQYIDIESELRALRAMESRLIDLIKNGKGEVKDLVVAEKQLGEYRVRIEKLEGEMRYYDNLVGMATLSIVAYEKDIQKPTAASEQENVTLALETEDVETKYRDARKILEDAKGRIVESELKKYDADQYSARIVVDVPPEKADFVTAQLKQIGKVANYNRDRKQTTTGGTGVPTVQVEQKDTRFVLSLYNLANVAPRETAVLTVAVRDVEGSYRKVIGLIRKPVEIQLKKGEPVELNFVPERATGRVVTSNLSGQQPQQMTGDIRADVREEEADTLLAAIRETGEVLTSTITENPDTTGTTSAKRGIQLRLVNVAAVPARETHTLRAVAGNVPEAYGKLLGALQGPGELAASVRIITSQLNETDPRTVTAKLSFEARRDVLPLISKAFADAGIDFLSRNMVRSNDAANTLDSKVYFQIDELIAADALAPRRTTVLGLEVDSVEKSLDSLRTSLSGTAAANVKEIEYNLTKEASGRVTGHLVIETPVGNAMAVLGHIKDLGGTEKVNQVMKNSQVPDAPFARERIDLTLMSREAIVESGKELGATIRAALGSSATALLYSLYLITTGVLFIGPFLIVIWIGYKLMRHRRVVGT